jgi:diacylglycerol kinase
MNSSKPFSLLSRIRSFGYALNGWRTLVREEPNALIHVIAAITAVICGFVFQISTTEWLAVILSIVIVLASELFNTSLELICDHIEPDRNTQIKKIKDLAAGAVLISSLGALAVGLIIFLPKIF